MNLNETSAFKPRRQKFIFILVVLFLTFNPHICFCKDSSLSLSGKYKGCNVILIVLDALRPDHLSCYGYSKKTSPNIDALAKQGVIFKNAFCQSVVTLPSVTSLFTSLYPFSHRVMHIFKDKVPEKVYILAQVLNTYGYKTAWFGVLDDPHTGKSEGLLKGFTEKYGVYPKKNDSANQKDREIIFSWIKENHKVPFFLMFHSYQTHEGTFVLTRFDNKFSQNVSKKFTHYLDTIEKREWERLRHTVKNHPETLYNILGKDWVQKNKEYFMLTFSQAKNLNSVIMKEPWEKRFLLHRWSSSLLFSFLHSLDEDGISNLLSLLDSSIYEFDTSMVSKLVNELKELKLYDKTIIIITADHANEYNEHGRLGHGNSLFDESIHVPLIFYIPNLLKPLRNEELVQSIDILPTVLDLLDIPIPHQAQGISLVGLMEAKDNALTNKYVYSQAFGGLLSIRSRQWKLIQKFKIDWVDLGPWEGLKNWDDSIQEWLFNLQKDKTEKNNLIDKKPKVARDLRQLLESKLNSLVVYQEGKSEFVEGLPKETKERIIKTGYW
jgi:arylsulfatase A-like enzyme